MEDYKYINRISFCIGASSFILGLVLLGEGEEYGLIPFIIGVFILLLSLSYFCCYEERTLRIAPLP
jgi:hypothetical protein